MKSRFAIGLMSGTSADGVSAVLASFRDRSWEFISYHCQSIPPHLIPKIRTGGRLSSQDLSRLNVELGEVFALAALQVLKKARVSPKNVTCIGSHGQTLYHGPEDPHPNTLQIGEPAIIAKRTQIPVVANFRQGDVAAGGEGAPLIPFFDFYFFGAGPVRAFQNIGGIANVTVVGKTVKNPLAFDTGPGNGLMDRVMHTMSHGKEGFDRNGGLAGKGKINMDLIHQMVDLPYFKKPPPKSTGPELFNHNFVHRFFGDEIMTQPKNVLATLNYFTCLTIQEAYRAFIFPDFQISEIVVSGGGVHNKTLMERLKCLFAPISVQSISQFGIPAQAKEPLAFAFFGLRRMENKVNHLPACTGASSPCILGSVTLP